MVCNFNCALLCTYKIAKGIELSDWPSPFNAQKTLRLSSNNRSEHVDADIRRWATINIISAWTTTIRIRIANNHRFIVSEIIFSFSKSNQLEKKCDNILHQRFISGLHMVMSFITLPRSGI